MVHQFILKVVLEEIVDGKKSEVLSAFSERRDADVVHLVPVDTLKAMSAQATTDVIKMFKKSRTGGGR